MKYIIMAGGIYPEFEKPRQLTEVFGEPLVERTIRLLRENGIEDIAISSTLEGFDGFGVPVLKHDNDFDLSRLDECWWLDAFYPMDEPVCYIFGDVYFSDEAIKKIVETETSGIEFFASKPPFPKEYTKPWAEPFAFKVADTAYFKTCIERVKNYLRQGLWKRDPIAWEMWQVVKDTKLNVINYNNYIAINDYTCDIDCEKDIERLKQAL